MAHSCPQPHSHRFATCYKDPDTKLSHQKWFQLLALSLSRAATTRAGGWLGVADVTMGVSGICGTDSLGRRLGYHGCSFELVWQDNQNTRLEVEWKPYFTFAHRSVINLHLLASVAYNCGMDTMIPGWNICCIRLWIFQIKHNATKIPASPILLKSLWENTESR